MLPSRARNFYKIVHPRAPLSTGGECGGEGLAPAHISINIIRVRRGAVKEIAVVRGKKPRPRYRGGVRKFSKNTSQLAYFLKRRLPRPSDLLLPPVSPLFYYTPYLSRVLPVLTSISWPPPRSFLFAYSSRYIRVCSPFVCRSRANKSLVSRDPNSTLQSVRTRQKAELARVYTLLLQAHALGKPGKWAMAAACQPPLFYSAASLALWRICFRIFARGLTSVACAHSLTVYMYMCMGGKGSEGRFIRAGELVRLIFGVYNAKRGGLRGCFWRRATRRIVDIYVDFGLARGWQKIRAWLI